MATSTALAGQAFRSTVLEAAAFSGGAVATGDGATKIAGVSTDSRTVAKGNLFVALAGDAFDGHAYVAKAGQSGAAAALVLASKVDELRSIGLPLIAVDDTLLALGMLGRSHRDGLKAPFVGITGSAGKSTAKEMTAAVLSWGNRKVLKTEGNLNNRIGVPLTVMGATPEHAACVIEMGISLVGEMPALVAVARPNVRVLLNAGSSHLEFLGSPEGVAREKAHIWDDRRESDWVIYNADDALVAREAEARPTKNRLSFGNRGKADVSIQTVKTTGFGEAEITLHLRGTPITTRLQIFGIHHAMNAAAAAAVGLALQVPTDQIAAGLERRFTPMPGRGDIRRLKDDVVLVDDSYNSNPTSAVASVEGIGKTRYGGRARTIAVLGDMLELGESARVGHARVGWQAAESEIDLVYLFGPNANAVAFGTRLGNQEQSLGFRPPEDLATMTAEQVELLAEGAKAPNARPRCMVFETRAALTEALLKDLRAGDAVLVKGSRGMKMDEVVAQVLKTRGSA